MITYMEKKAKESTDTHTQSVVNLKGKEKFGICAASWFRHIPHISDFSALRMIKAQTHLQILSSHLVDVNHAAWGLAPASRADLRVKQSDTVIWGRCSRFHVDIAFFFFFRKSFWKQETHPTPVTVWHTASLNIVRQKQVQCVMPVHFWCKRTVDSNRKNPYHVSRLGQKHLRIVFVFSLPTSAQLSVKNCFQRTCFYVPY